LVGVEEEKDVDNDQWTPVNLMAGKLPGNEEVKVLSDDENTEKTV
jgi:hypothetical protein|tara:strand:- start:139 stop:273 length:135 start_codon:yes stop_codon:yes gene_type:complete